MRLELIATGDELLNGTIVDTNSPWLMERLAALGLPVCSKTMVRDVREDIVALLRAASARSDVLICSGGLGPTADDITAECAAEAAGAALELHEPTLAALTARLAKRGIAVTSNNRRQAMVPSGAIVHANRFGTAPMLELRMSRARVFLLPGVPREYRGLCEETLLPELRGLAAQAPRRLVRVLRCFGVAESHVDAALEGFAKEFRGSIGYRTTLPENHVRLVAVGTDAGQLEALLARACAEAARRIGPGCFGADGVGFSETLGKLLRSRGATVGVAESLTGGLVGALLTEAAGASEYTRISIVAYSDHAKVSALGVPAEFLRAHGAVSAPVAAAMAQQVRERAGADFGVACTGLAGPGLAGSGEAVGTVFTALSNSAGVTTVRHAFGGDRERVRAFAAYATLEPLRRELLGNISSRPAVTTPAAATPLSPPSWRTPLALVGASLFLFALFSGDRFLHQSQAPQFVYQAEAFLHGQTALAVPPPNLNDWARAGGNWYVSFPPFPAVAMMPFVWLFGYQFNDVSFTVLFAALNVALFFLVLRNLSAAGESPRSDRENAILALLFAFGSVDFYCSIRGEVWFTAEVIGVTCTCLYLLAAHRAAHPALAGLALACAAITRTPLAFSVVYFALELFVPEGTLDLAELRRRRGEILERGLQFAGPVVAVAIPMMWMNHVRFGDALEFGHKHLFNNRVNGDITRWGLFNVHYLWRNLRAAFLLLPNPSLPGGFDPHGLSLFITTPLFVLLLWPRLRPRMHRLLWLTVAAVSIPGFFYQNDGWRQFGFRFSLDYTPYLFVLLGVGGRRFNALFWALAVLGLAVNVWGAVAFR